MRDTPARAALREMGVLREADGRAWLELSTSGTAGTPRRVRRSLASWEGSFDHVTRLTGTRPTDRVLVPAPPTGSMFAFARAHLAHVGAQIVGLDRWSLRDAESALATCTLAHLTPAMLTSLLDRDLGRLRTVVCAGAALPEGVRLRAHDGRGRGRRLLRRGRAELRGDRDGRRLEPFPQVEVDLRDGVVWARSPWLCDGYAPGEAGPDAARRRRLGDRRRPGPPRRRARTRRPRPRDDTVTTGGATVALRRRRGRRS